MPTLTMECELCERELERLTTHHLIPRQYTKRKKIAISSTIEICSACHKQLHRLFTHKQLAEELNSIEKLQTEPQMKRFLHWVAKQDPHKRVRVHR